MFNSIVLDVVIGLVFIYLLYSLFVTILAELIATLFSFRARNLKNSIYRMLNDENPKDSTSSSATKKGIKKSRNAILKAFYNDPEIKYLGSSGMFKSPSTFKASSFANVVASMIITEFTAEDKQDAKKEDEKASPAVKTIKYTLNDKIKDPDDPSKEISLDPETIIYLKRLWADAVQDKTKFKTELEAWFDRTMEQTKEWYTRKIRFVTFILGFLVAWFFYADTFVIIKNISNDEKARDALVSMANTYVQNNQIAVDTSKIKSDAELKKYRERLDSLLVIKTQLQSDINRANNILGLGGWPPDAVTVTYDSITEKVNYSPQIDPKSLSKVDSAIENGVIEFSFGKKVGYLFSLLWHHFFGLAVTAIAISLGAPFWFDLLNKVMNLKTSQKEEPKTKSASDKTLPETT